MKKKKLFRISRWLGAFLILALVFLAVGLGTLGSTHSVGKAYRLVAQKDDSKPAIVIQLMDPDHGTEEHEHKDLYLQYIYVNVGAVYAEYGESATLRIGRSSVANGEFPTYVDLEVVNLFKNVTDKETETTSTVLGDNLNNWVSVDLSKFTKSSRRISTFQYYQLIARNHDMLINEIVFVGNEVSSNQDVTEYVGTPVVLDAKVHETSASTIPKKFEGESESERIARASAILDGQSMPSSAQSSYFRYGIEEIAPLMTISEMRQGGEYADGLVYHMDKTYNSFGLDILSIGTGIFGMSPFGLRFMPFLASFGVLVFGFLFVKRLLRSEKAGFVFALLYALCGLSMSLGHFGTPLMIGLCFLVASLYFCSRFFDGGMKKAKFISAVPVLLSGLFAAAAICSNGAFVIPVVGIVAFFAAGVVRQRRTMRVALDAAIEEAEQEEQIKKPVPAAEGEHVVSEGRAKVAKIVNERRYKTAVSIGVFSAFLLLGTLLISVLAALPLYSVFTKVYDSPAAPSRNIFYFVWQAFAGGFRGGNGIPVTQSAWDLTYELFRGSGETFAVTLAGTFVAIVPVVLGLAGVVYAIVRLAKGVNGSSFKEMLAVDLVLFIGFAVALITASFAAGALDFLFLAYLFLFAFAALPARDLLGAESENGETAKKSKLWWIVIPCLVLLILGFLTFAVFTFSIPLPAAFMNSVL